MTTKTYDQEPVFDPKKPFKEIKDEPVFDPNKPFEALDVDDEPIKKKEPTTFWEKLNQAGRDYLRGSKVPESDGLSTLSDKEKVLDYLQRTKSPEQKKLAQPTPGIVNKSTPGRVIKKPISELEKPLTTDIDDKARRKLDDIMYGDKWEDPVRAITDEKPKDYEELRVLNRAAELTRASLAGDGADAYRLINSDYLRFKDDNNLTANMVRKRADEYDKVVAPLRNIVVPENIDGASDEWIKLNYAPLLQQAAVKWYASENPNFAKQLQAAGINLEDPVNLENQIGDSGKLGSIVNEYMRQRDVHSFVKKENPNLAPVFQSAENNLIRDYKDFGINAVANKVSKARQEEGLNSIDPIFNYYGDAAKGATNAVAEKFLTPAELEIYNKHIRDNQEQYIDAPSFFAGFAEGGKSIFKGIGETFQSLFEGGEKQIRDTWQKEASHVSADPKGFSKFMNNAGHGTGVVATIIATGNVLGALGVLGGAASGGIFATKVVPALQGILPFMGDMVEQGYAKFPDSPVKAWTSGLINTSMYAALAYKWLPASKIDKAMGIIKPEVDDIVNKLANGTITREAARQQAGGIFKKGFDIAMEGIQSNTKVAAEMTGITMLNKAMDKVMGMDDKTFEQFHPAGEEADTFTSMWLTNSVVAGAGAIAKIRGKAKVMSESLYEMASNPKKYERVINDQSTKLSFGDINEMKENLKFISSVKAELDGLKIHPKDQKRFIFESLKEKVAAQNLEKTTDPTIQKQEKDKIKESQEIKERILAGEDADAIVTTSEQKVIDENKKKQEEQEKVELELESLTKEKELHNKEFDLKTKGLDGRNAEDKIKKDKLELQRETKNKEYDSKIQKLSSQKQEAPPVEEAVTRGPEMEGLLGELKSKAGEFEKQENLQYFIDKAAEAPAQYYEKYGKEATDKLLEYTPTEKLKQNLDDLLEISTDNPNVPILDKLIAEREKKVSVIMPGEIPNRETITIAPKENVPDVKPKISIILPKQNEPAKQDVVESTQPVSPEKETTPTEPPIEPPKGTEEGGEGEAVGITHAANEVRRRDRLLPEYQKEPQSFEEWNNEAEKRIKEGYDIEGLLDKIEKGHDPTPVENAIRKIYVATLDAEIAKNPTDALLTKQKRFIEIGDLANSRAGRNLVSLKGEGSPLATLSDFYVAKMEAAGVDKLTEKQKEDTKKAFDDVQKADENAAAAMEAYREEIAKLKAENELLKSSKTTKPKAKTKNYSEERKQIIGDILLKFSKASGEGASFLGAKELSSIAPDVLKLVKNLIEEGVVKLSEVVDNIYQSLKEGIPDLEKKHIHDIIAGEYNKKKPTRNELAAKMRDLKDEAYYINKLERLLSGEEPKNEKRKVERNRQISELQQKIKDFKKEEREANKFYKEEFIKEEIPDDLKKLNSIKKRNETETAKIQERIVKGDFETKKIIPFLEDKEMQKKFHKQYNATLDAVKKREDARHEFDIALLRDEMSRRTTGQKITDNLGKAAGTIKAITTGIDDSAVAIQTYMSMLVRPRTGARAFYEHIRQGGSQKKFDRWLTALHTSADFKEMKDMGLDVTEPQSLKEREKEEIFNNRFSGTIKIKGKEYKVLDAPLRPFERAFTTLGNVTRVVGYRTISAKYKREGFTPEKNPELFKSLARRLNTETGRGAVNEYVDMANKVVTIGIWSPKLMATKFNILGISDLASTVLSKVGTKGYYRQLHPRERIAAIKDVAQFATTVVALSYGLALAFGGDIDTDPLSSTFMDVRLPNGKSYNLTGGFSGYIRAIAQFMVGKKSKDGIVKDVNRLETAGRFFRGKTPPLTSAVLNMASGKNYMGEPSTPLGEVLNLAPISLRGIGQQIQNDGASSFFTQGIPTFFGFNVKNEKDYQKDDGLSDEDRKDTTIKYFLDKGATLPQSNPKQIEIEDADGKTLKKLSEYPKEIQEKYNKAKLKYLKEQLTDLKNGDIIVYIDSYGRVSLTNDKGEKEEALISKLTPKQLTEIISSLGQRATENAKKEVFEKYQ